MKDKNGIELYCGDLVTFCKFPLLGIVEKFEITKAGYNRVHILTIDNEFIFCLYNNKIGCTGNFVANAPVRNDVNVLTFENNPCGQTINDPCFSI